MCKLMYHFEVGNAEAFLQKLIKEYQMLTKFKNKKTIFKFKYCFSKKILYI